MVGDNDAGAFGTYTQAGQNYGTTLLWTLLLLIPVLYVNQEMVLRLGAVAGVGHARLILERFGKFWGAFSVIDLFLLNALTIVTEFIGIALALDFLGVSRELGVALAAVLIMAAASTGSFRRFERFSMALVFGSLLLIPVFIAIHPPLSQIARDFVTPQLPAGAKLSDVMLLIIAIVGTTIAPWQLFFQQSYVIDKRITPRFMSYGKADLWVGIVMVIAGAAAMMAFTAAAFAGKPEFGAFTDAGAVATGLGKYAGRATGVMFAIALIDACIIGASAVSLSTAYAIGDVLSLKHSLHRKASDAKGFYAVYCGLIVISAGLVLTPGAPLGLLTNAVQTLAGVLAAERDGFPAAALQRQAGARTLGQHPLAQHFYGGGDSGSGDPVDHPDGVGDVPGCDQRDGHSRYTRRRRRAGRARRAGGPVLQGQERRGGDARRQNRSGPSRRMADAAAGHPCAGQAVAIGADMDVYSALLSGDRGRSGVGAHRDPRHRPQVMARDRELGLYCTGALAAQARKPARSWSSLRWRPMKTMRLERCSPGFQSRCNSPSRIMCTP